jgi:membrane carboxypeptidase/penicillin-binding protein PbpC
VRPAEPIDIVPKPADLRDQEICALSGMPANAWCPSRQHESLPESGDAPCSWHHLSDGGLLVVWPPEYRQWAKQQGLAESRPAVPPASAPHRAEALAPAARPALEITSPPPGAVYLIDPTLRREFQTVALRAASLRPASIEWHINGQPIGTSSSESPLMWSLTPGTHTVVAKDSQGNASQISFVVR